MNVRPVPQCAYDFIKAHEGLRLVAYEDLAGVVTVGYGHVALGQKIGATITQSLADLYLKGDADSASKSVCARLSESVLLDLTENQYAALISFVFNMGPQPQATLWKLINARDHDHVPGELMRWVYAKDPASGKEVKVQGLVNRRAAEVALWSTDEPGSVDTAPSSAATRAMPTPPLKPKSPFSLGHVIAACTACAGGVSEGAKKVIDAATPFNGSPVVQHILSYAETAGAVAAVLVALLLWKKSQEAKQ